MNTICEYDEKIDVGVVKPGLSLDLQAAIDNGVVIDSGSVTDSNGIENTSEVWCRIRDAFDAVNAQRSLDRAARASIKSSTNQSTSDEVTSA